MRDDLGEVPNKPVDKYKLAGYMANLLTLLEAQDTSGVHNRSTTFADEYNRCWDLLKETITKEQEDEARKRKDDTGRREANAGNQSG